MTDGDSVTINTLCNSANGTFVTLDDYLPITPVDVVGRHLRCREAWVRTGSSAIWTWEFCQLDARRIEVIVDGLSLWHTVVSPLHGDGSARRNAATSSGVALQVVHVPELSGEGERARLVVLQPKWGSLVPGDADFLNVMAKAKAEEYPRASDVGVPCWLVAWPSLAVSLLERRPVPGTGGDIPSMQKKCTLNFLAQMFGFRKCTEFHLKSTLSLLDLRQNQSPETVPACIVWQCFPQNKTASIHMCDECKKSNDPSVCHRF